MAVITASAVVAGLATVAQAAGPDTQQAKLTASDGAADDLFGYSVAVSGDTAVVGAWGDNVGSNADQGSAYVFTGTRTTPVPSASFWGLAGLAGAFAVLGVWLAARRRRQA